MLKVTWYVIHWDISVTPSKIICPTHYVYLAYCLMFGWDRERTSGNTGNRCQPGCAIPGPKELTVGEIEPKHRRIRYPPEIDRFALPYDRISQSREVPDG